MECQCIKFHFHTSTIQTVQKSTNFQWRHQIPSTQYQTAKGKQTASELPYLQRHHRPPSIFHQDYKITLGMIRSQRIICNQKVAVAPDPFRMKKKIATNQSTMKMWKLIKYWRSVLELVGKIVPTKESRKHVNIRIN